MTQLALALDHRPAMGEADFLVASSNRDAVLWLDRWPDWPGAGLAIHGPAGCGKSHLAQVWRRRSGARSITAATIANEDPASLLSDCIGFAIEDADRGVDERALLHLYNWTAEQGGNLLLTGRSPPARWGIALPDLRSRLAAMPAVAVTPPDDALFAAVLIKHFADRQLRVEDSVVHYINSRCERSFEAAGRIVAALDAAALAEKRNITVPLASRVLTDFAAN